MTDIKTFFKQLFCRHDWRMKIHLFKRKIKHFSQRLIYGFDDSVTWSLDQQMGKWILPRLKRYRIITFAYPSNLKTIEEWHTILDEMIAAFEIIADDRYYMLTPELQIKIDKGLDLFRKWYQALWW